MKPDPLHLRTQPTSQSQFDAAFGVLARVGTWLERKGRHQRIGLTSRGTYESWQTAGWNHVVLHDHTIVGVFSLCHVTLADWQDSAPAHPVPFLRALATDPDWSGCGVGAFGIAAAIDVAAPQAVWLDCVSDFLPDYYSRHGFHRINRRIIHADDQEYDVSLMCSRLTDN